MNPLSHHDSYNNLSNCNPLSFNTEKKTYFFSKSQNIVEHKLVKCRYLVWHIYKLCLPFHKGYEIPQVSQTCLVGFSNVNIYLMSNKIRQLDIKFALIRLFVKTWYQPRYQFDISDLVGLFYFGLFIFYLTCVSIFHKERLLPLEIILQHFLNNSNSAFWNKRDFISENHAFKTWQVKLRHFIQAFEEWVSVQYVYRLG